ncbi:recombinase RecT [Streptomyces sp. MBT49]|uniref:recombinase RecT n=1 Tax=unclassified Streptomyces TaxID=2593676 RepID=UPI001909B55D|nr:MULTISPECIES: recombinase RecT [unclassified Streptomyces]MBK3625459.1 recombinase RecT [Streptomyces sp. MBT49]MBK3633278.1 recombinase RecT [Streptomyces sp. MBT97]
MTLDLLGRVRASETAAAPSGGGRPAGVEEAPVPTVPAAPVESETAEALHTWLTRYEGHIARRLPSHVEAGAFLAAVRDRLPKLEGCSPASILDAVLACASFGFIPDGREAVISRDGTLATFIPTYRGYVKAMHNSGFVTSVRVEMVYEGDEFAYEPTRPAPDDFVHRPNLAIPKGKRGEPKFAYAFAWLRGGDRSQPIILSSEDADEIRDLYSKAYQRARDHGTDDSFWHTHRPDMWRKSAIRRLYKVVPTSAEMRALEAVEEAAEAGRPQLDHAPDAEAAALVAEAERAARAAEASQDRPPARLPVKASKGRRHPLKKPRGRRAAARRA